MPKKSICAQLQVTSEGTEAGGSQYGPKLEKEMRRTLVPHERMRDVQRSADGCVPEPEVVYDRMSIGFRKPPVYSSLRRSGSSFAI